MVMEIVIYVIITIIMEEYRVVPIIVEQEVNHYQEHQVQPVIARKDGY
jgi:hypothetical protein